MQILGAGHTPSRSGPKEWFTGAVRIDSLFNPGDASRVQGALVTFDAGARTAWHTHPLGQTLYVTAGVGRVQVLGGAIQEIRPGDVVLIAPGEKHWHGAGPHTGMTHLAIQEVKDGQMVHWMEHVTDADYLG